MRRQLSDMLMRRADMRVMTSQSRASTVPLAPAGHNASSLLEDEEQDSNADKDHGEGHHSGDEGM
jgi:hypothetical protein